MDGKIGLGLGKDGLFFSVSGHIPSASPILSLGEGWRMPFDATFWFCMSILFDYTLFIRWWMVFEGMLGGGVI